MAGEEREDGRGRLVRLGHPGRPRGARPAASPAWPTSPSTGAACTATQKLGMRSRHLPRGGRHGQAPRGLRHARGRKRHHALARRGGLLPHHHRRGAGGHVRVPSLRVRQAWRTSRNRENVPVAMHLAGNREESSTSSGTARRRSRCTTMGVRSAATWRSRHGLPTGTSPVRYALNWGAFEIVGRPGHPLRARGRRGREEAQGVRRGRRPCARAATRSWAWAWPRSTEFLRSGLRTRSSAPTRRPPRTRTDLLTEMRHRHAGAARRERGPVPRLGHHAGDGHHRRRARAASLDDKIGSLDIGKRADLVAVDLSGSHQTPTTDPVSAVVNTCSGDRRAHDHGGRRAAVRKEQMAC